MTDGTRAEPLMLERSFAGAPFDVEASRSRRCSRQPDRCWPSVRSLAPKPALPGRLRTGHGSRHPDLVGPDSPGRGRRPAPPAALPVSRRGRRRAVRPAGCAPAGSGDTGAAPIPARVRQPAALPRGAQPLHPGRPGGPPSSGTGRPHRHPARRRVRSGDLVDSPPARLRDPPHRAVRPADRPRADPGGARPPAGVRRRGRHRARRHLHRTVTVNATARRSRSRPQARR
jgi:hypothetical protein